MAPADVGVEMPALPNMDTRSSSGFEDVNKLVPDLVTGSERVVEASPSPNEAFSPSGSSKSRRFSACWPATTVLRAFSRAETSSSRLKRTMGGQ